MTEEDGERQAMCSGCGAVVAESDIHVIPHFNETANQYVTTFRCENCWHAALTATRKRLGDAAADEIALLVSFFERYGYIVHEARRGDPIAVIRTILARMIGMLESGAIRLAIGPTQ